MSAPFEEFQIDHSADSVMQEVHFDPTAKDAAHVAFVLTHAVHELPQHAGIPQTAIERTVPVIDQVREAALIALKDAPLPNGKRISRPSEADLNNPDSTAARMIASEGETPWIPATREEITEAKKEIVLNPMAAMVAKAALEHVAHAKPLSLANDARAARKEARNVLANLFGERHRLREAASTLVDTTLKVGSIAVEAAAILPKIYYRR